MKTLRYFSLLTLFCSLCAVSGLRAQVPTSPVGVPSAETPTAPGRTSGTTAQAPGRTSGNPAPGRTTAAGTRTGTRTSTTNQGGVYCPPGGNAGTASTPRATSTRRTTWSTRPAAPRSSTSPNWSSRRTSTSVRVPSRSRNQASTRTSRTNQSNNRGNRAPDKPKPNMCPTGWN